MRALYDRTGIFNMALYAHLIAERDEWLRSIRVGDAVAIVEMGSGRWRIAEVKRLSRPRARDGKRRWCWVLDTIDEGPAASGLLYERRDGSLFLRGYPGDETLVQLPAMGEA